MQVRGVSQMVETGQDSARAAVSRAPLSADDAGVRKARLNEIRFQESLFVIGFCLSPLDFVCNPSDIHAEEFVFLIYMKKY